MASSSLIDTLRSVLCCCLGEQRQQQQNPYQQHELPDENTLLITPNEPTISYGDISYQDQQKLQQRLGTIVRSKEGKMVNVGSTIPFNLHNQVIAEDRTISRSNSGSLDLSSGRYHHQNNTYSSNANNNNNNYYSSHTDYNHSPLTRSRSRSASASPSHDNGDDNDNEYSSSTSTSRRRRLTTEQPKPTPILNVRLVGYNKPPPSTTMRGRARERGSHPSGLPAPMSPKGAATSAAGAGGLKPGEGEDGKKTSVSPSKIKKKPTLVLDDVSSIAVSWDD